MAHYEIQYQLDYKLENNIKLSENNSDPSKNMYATKLQVQNMNVGILEINP